MISSLSVVSQLEITINKKVFAKKPLTTLYEIDSYMKYTVTDHRK